MFSAHFHRERQGPCRPDVVLICWYLKALDNDPSPVPATRRPSCAGSISSCRNRRFTRNWTDDLAAAADLAAQIPPLQEQYGLDSLRVLELMATAGQELFQGHHSGRSRRPFPTPGSDPGETGPLLGEPDHDDLVGYHIVTTGRLGRACPGPGSTTAWVSSSKNPHLRRHPRLRGCRPETAIGPGCSA